VSPTAPGDHEHRHPGLRSCLNLTGSLASGRREPSREERSKNTGCQEEAARHGLG
jgi:hypothetical protein